MKRVIDRPNMFFVVIMLVAATMAAIAIRIVPEAKLELYDYGSGELITSFPMSGGGEFAISFMHSVNGAPFTDYYRIEDSDIILTGCRFYNLGGGLEPAVRPSDKLSYDEGSFRLEGTERVQNSLCYAASASFDLVLIIGSEKQSLGLLCGKNRIIEFRAN